MENNISEQIISNVENYMKNSFELGMKYKRLEVANKLIPILRQNEFDPETIVAILRDASLMEDESYADIFTADSE